MRDFIRRQLEATRTQWLANIRQVMHAPDGAEVAVIETAERDEEGRPTLIRLTTDPHAPLYGQVDPDQSHPYRQKEVIREVTARLGEGAVNAFGIDGDEIYDPVGLGAFRTELFAGRFDPWWVAPPHHVNYFDVTSIQRLLSDTRWPDAFKRSIGVALKDEEDLHFISPRLDALIAEAAA